MTPVANTRRSPPPWYDGAALALTLAAAGVVVVSFGLWTNRWAARKPSYFNLDYRRVCQAGERLNNGQSPYTGARDFAEALWAGQRWSDIPSRVALGAVAYPPLVPVLGWLACQWPWAWVSWLWSWANIALIVAACIWAGQAALAGMAPGVGDGLSVGGLAPPTRPWLTTALTVGLIPSLLLLTPALWTLRAEMLLGNSEVILLAAMALAARELSRHRQATAGAAVGLAAAYKLAPILLVVALAVSGRPRAALWALGTAVALTAAATAVIALVAGESLVQPLADFAVAYSFKLHPDFLPMHENVSVWAVFLRPWYVNESNIAFPAAGHHPLWAAGGIVAVNVLVIGGWLTVETRAHRRRQPWSPLSWGLAVATLLMVMPFVRIDYVVELLVAVPAAVVAIAGRRRSQALLAAAVLVLGLYLIGLRDSDITRKAMALQAEPMSSTWLANLWLSRVMIGIFVLWGLLMALRWTEAPPATAPSPDNLLGGPDNGLAAPQQPV